jgi:hypothetical protein
MEWDTEHSIRISTWDTDTVQFHALTTIWCILTCWYWSPSLVYDHYDLYVDLLQYDGPWRSRRDHGWIGPQTRVREYGRVVYGGEFSDVCLDWSGGSYLLSLTELWLSYDRVTTAITTWTVNGGIHRGRDFAEP